MRRQHDAEVIHAGRRWWTRRQGLRHLPVHVATEDERDRLASRMTFPVHLEAGQVLRIKTQLDAPTNQRRIHAIAITSQRDRGGAGDAAQRRPTEGFAQQRRLNGVEWTL